MARYVLGIETSCDETSCSIVRQRQVISLATLSSLRLHKKYGGIIPEIASRCHLKVIEQVCDLALQQAQLNLKKISLIAVTYRPGLIGSLAVGLQFAKGLSLALNKPMIPINHLHAHLFAPFLNKKDKIPFPFIGLVVSGGHTNLFLVKDFNRIYEIGRTRDDAAGEVLDKVGRHCGLPYPAGVYIDKLYNYNYREKIPLNCANLKYDFSFSGIKTAAIYKQAQLEQKKIWNKSTKIQLLSSLMEKIMQTIVQTSISLCLYKKINRLVCGGGVTANSRLRQLLIEQTSKEGIELIISPKEYTADNGAMVAGLGFYLYNIMKGKMPDFLNQEAIASG